MILHNQTYKCYCHLLPPHVHRTLSWWSEWPVQIIAQSIQGEGLNVHCRVEQLRKINIGLSILKQKTNICLNKSLCTHVREVIVVHPRITIITAIEKNLKHPDFQHCVYIT